MKRSETALVLAEIAVIDNRRTDPPDADVRNPMGTPILSAWHGLIGHLEMADCIEAVKRHRQSSTAYLVPAHVVQGVREIRDARLDDGPPYAELMAGVDPTIPGREWARIYRERRTMIADGMPAAELRAIAGGRS